MNGDAFSSECRQTVIDLIKKPGQVDYGGLLAGFAGA
ncbi:hypothetical protein M8494_14455 [Serratia ureilytica]